MKNPSKRITWKEISRQKFLMVCAAIFFVYGIVFYYVPLAGWVMAFQDYKPKDGLFVEPKPFATVPEGRITGPAAAVGLRGWDLSDAPW
ncbi:transport system permease protein, partial [human gut metagenome]